MQTFDLYEERSMIKSILNITLILVDKLCSAR